MTRILELLIMIWLLFFNFATCQNHLAGSLVIAGGDLEVNNKNVYHQLIELAGGTEKASFAIIPSASGVPVQSYAGFRKTLVSYGVSPDNIHLVRIAMMDDDSTAGVDESLWKENGNDREMADLVKNCSGVWFTGGDQNRTTKTLFNEDGSKTLVLESVWEVYLSGGVIGGTSAGAAIMSEVMIGGGSSLGALTHGVITDYTGDDFPKGSGVLLTKGLGFFPFGIVDQHFDDPPRIGRLIVAMLNENNPVNLGFGIDENTALIYFGSINTCRVAGPSGVTIINATRASLSKSGNRPVISNLLVTRLEDGDSYDLESGEVTPATGKQPISGNEYYNISLPGQGGVLSGYSTEFSDLLIVNLMDNKATGMVKNLSFVNDTTGFMLTLSKIAESKGYYTDKPDGEDHYTIVNVQMDIVPVQVFITPIK